MDRVGTRMLAHTHTHTRAHTHTHTRTHTHTHTHTQEYNPHHSIATDVSGEQMVQNLSIVKKKKQTAV